MVGYWIVAALVAAAVVSVIVAGTIPNPPRRQRPLRWVVLAASDAAPGPDGPTWPEMVVADLAPASIELRNASVGALTIDLADRELPVILAEEFEIATVWLAINDLVAGRPLPDYLGDLDRLLGALAQPGRSLAVGNVPDLATVPLLATLVDLEALRAACLRWNDGIAAVAAVHGAAVIDLSGRPVTADDLAPDGFHPSQAGQRRLAAAFGPWVAAQASAQQVVARRPPAH